MKRIGESSHLIFVLTSESSSLYINRIVIFENLVGLKFQGIQAFSVPGPLYNPFGRQS